MSLLRLLVVLVTIHARSSKTEKAQSTKSAKPTGASRTVGLLAQSNRSAKERCKKCSCYRAWNWISKCGRRI